MIFSKYAAFAAPATQYRRPMSQPVRQPQNMSRYNSYGRRPVKLTFRGFYASFGDDDGYNPVDFSTTSQVYPTPDGNAPIDTGTTSTSTTTTSLDYNTNLQADPTETAQAAAAEAQRQAQIQQQGSGVGGTISTVSTAVGQGASSIGTTLSSILKSLGVNTGSTTSGQTPPGYWNLGGFIISPMVLVGAAALIAGGVYLTFRKKK